VLETRARRALRQPRSADHGSTDLAATRESRRAEQPAELQVCRDASDLISSRCAPCARLESCDTRTSDELLPDRKLILDVAESVRIRPSQVLKQALTLMNLHQQASPARVILLMGLQVLGQVGDPLGQYGNLDFWRTGVRLSTLILANQLCFPIHTHLHAAVPTRCRVRRSVRNSTSEIERASSRKALRSEFDTSTVSDRYSNNGRKDFNGKRNRVGWGRQAVPSWPSQLLWVEPRRRSLHDGQAPANSGWPLAGVLVPVVWTFTTSASGATGGLAESSQVRCQTSKQRRAHRR
jgi:hypothetical protein